MVNKFYPREIKFLFYSILFYSILFYSILFYSMPTSSIFDCPCVPMWLISPVNGVNDPRKSMQRDSTSFMQLPVS